MIARKTEFVCLGCGDVRADPAAVCLRCGGTLQERISIETEDSARFSEKEEVVGQESRPGVDAVVFKSFEGTRSHSTLANSRVELTLSGPLDLGKPAEGRVADRIISALRAEGRSVDYLPHEDARGEDRKIRCDGTAVDVQVVSVPSDCSFLREASQRSAYTGVSILEAATWINDALSAKATRYSSAQKDATLLAIDVRHVSVLVAEEVVRTVEQTFGNPCTSHGFGAVWLVGPVDSRCTKFQSSRW
jgi:hypothetical protein